MVVFQLEQCEPVLVTQVRQTVAGFTGRFPLLQLLEENLCPFEVMPMRLDNIYSQPREFIL